MPKVHTKLTAEAIRQLTPDATQLSELVGQHVVVTVHKTRKYSKLVPARGKRAALRRAVAAVKHGKPTPAAPIDLEFVAECRRAVAGKPVLTAAQVRARMTGVTTDPAGVVIAARRGR